MPEGDTVHHAALRVGAALAGHVPGELLTPHPRFARDGWPGRLAGREIEAVEARGKHLLLRFAGGLVVHSHLRMTGAWRVLARGERWPRPARTAWLVVRRGEHEVVQFNGPVLERLTAARVRSDPRLTRLGPDIVAAAPFDEARFLRRLREADPTRAIGDALLDQHVLAGIGNAWKSEGCWLARLDPWRPAREVRDDEALAVVRAVRPLMQQSAASGRHGRREVYERAAQPCRCCGPPHVIRGCGQGDDNRTTYWCPACQR
ncbi:MAG: DNA-formamidopyrimidine glycosylase family protein [Thermoleophilia bacterium]